MASIVEMIDSIINKKADSAVVFLQKLIQEKSIQGNESFAQAIVVEKLRQLGCTIDIYEPDIEDLKKEKYFITTRESFKGSPNVIGVLKGTGSGRSILLNGHIDVVPEGDRTKWHYHPYEGKIEEGKIYGRGTTDMKGGSVSLLLALESIVEANIDLMGDVIFQSVIDEEAGGAGTLSAIQRGYKADAAIIPEPTNMNLFIKQQGSMWFRMTIKGKSAHGGTKYEGVCAIEKAFFIYRKLMQLEKIRNERNKDELYNHLPIPFPINLGVIQGGSWPSSVADEVVLEGRIGVAPHENLFHVRKELESYVKAVYKEDSWFIHHPVQIEWFGAHWIPNFVEKTNPFVMVASEQFQQIYKKEIEVCGAPWGTDAGLLGVVANIPTIVIGPGETKVAHYSNEYIEINEMIESAKYYARIIIEWCGCRRKE